MPVQAKVFCKSEHTVNLVQALPHSSCACFVNR